MIEFMNLSGQEYPVAIAVNEYRTVILDIDATGPTPAIGLTPDEAMELANLLMNASTFAAEEQKEK